MRLYSVLNTELELVLHKLNQLYDCLILDLLNNFNQTILKIDVAKELKNNKLNSYIRYKFIEQKLILKEIQSLNSKQKEISINSLLNVLSKKSNGSSEANKNYKKSIKYFQSLVKNKLSRFNKKKLRIDEIIKNIQISKYQIVILLERINLYRLLKKQY
ncbi:MAG: hypothetical protein LBL60_02860 [Mycoplasmataceae bacterium]|nr:hypothetical protein [Mycoplasmataceae bacterium]